MLPDELFAVWAPETSPWSAWAKPALFIHIPSFIEEIPLGSQIELPELSWAPSASDRYAIILELPGASSIFTGLAFAARGFRPIPLFNTTPGKNAVVSVDEIVRGLILGASQLYGSALAADAPPVFLLDSLRLSAGTPLQPGVYDNRWMVFPQDFPSANILLSKGISKVLVVRHERTELPSDLPHVLLRWQEAGLIVYSKDAMTSGPPTPLSIARPKWYRAAWQRALVMLRLRPNSAGGFGAVVPDPSSGYGIG